MYSRIVFKQYIKCIKDRTNESIKVLEQPRAISLLYAFVCWISLSTFEAQMPILIRLICCTICYTGGQKSNDIKAFISTQFDTFFRKALLLFLEIYISFAFVGIFFLDTDHEFSFAGNKIFFAIFSLFWGRVFTHMIIYFFSIKRDTQKQEIKHYWKRFIELAAVGIAVSVIFLIAFNPAITSVDSQGLYVLAKELGKETFTMTDWQPPFYVFLIGILIKIWDSITFLVVLQVIYFFLVISDCILFLYKEGVPKRILILIYIAIVCGYNNQIMLVTFWKDIPFTTSMIWLTLLLMKLVLEKDKYINSFVFYIELFMSLFLTALLRQNGIYAVMLLLAILPVLFRKKRFIGLSAVTLISIIMIKGPVYDLNNIIPQPSLKYLAMGNDILYLYFDGEVLDEETQALVNQLLKGEERREGIIYSPYWGEYYHADLTDYSVPQFMNIYIRNFIKHPKDMITAFLKRTQIIWSVSKNYNEITSCIHYIGETNNVEPCPYPHRINNFLTDILTNIILLLNKPHTLYIIFWRPGLYNLLIFVIFILLLCKHIHLEARIKFLLPMIPIVLNIFVLCCSSAWPDYRYHWPSVLISMVLGTYYLRVNCQTEI